MIKKIRKFISEVRGELAKAQWPVDPNEKGFRKFRELFDSTKVVMIAMLLLGGYIAFCDVVLVQVFGSITHRQQKTEQVAKP